MRRVAITGIGIVSPLGADRETTWRAVLNGESGARLIEAFDARTWPVRFACEVKGFVPGADAVLPGAHAYLSRPAAFGVQAAFEAMNDSQVQGTVDGARFGVSVGASMGAVSPVALVKILSAAVAPGGAMAPKGGGPTETTALLRNHPGTLGHLLGARWGALGPTTTIQTACASSGQSVGQAFLQIQRGEADVMLAGGADSLQAELMLAGFCLLGTLSTRNEYPDRGSRPFDKDRDGFVAGEGAAFLVLEELSRAKARGAKIYAEVGGYGETASAYRITDMPEDGRGIVEAMELAVKGAGVGFQDVGYVNAHGTSTALNDRVEALAVRKVFLARGGKPLVSSTKSEIGHLISAAGAMEAAFCALTVRDGQVPPTRSLYKTDCGDDIDFVAHEARAKSVDVAVSNSIGFGGSNSSILVRRSG